MPPPSIIPSPGSGSAASRKRKGRPQPIAPAPPKHLPGRLQQRIEGELRSSPSMSVSSVDQENDNDEYLPQPSSKTSKQSTSTISRKRTAASTSTNHNQSQGGAGTGGAGSGGGKMSKMSREALRKANHSLIERRRREKINAALGELREMVPGLGEGGSKGGEFKLEVLERTVAHMKDLKKHIESLESALLAHGIHFEPQDSHNGKQDDDDGDDNDDEEEEDEDDDDDNENTVDDRNVAGVQAVNDGAANLASGFAPGSARDTDNGLSGAYDTYTASSAPSNSLKRAQPYCREHYQQPHTVPAYNQHLAHVQSESQTYKRQHAHSPYPSPSPDAYHYPLSPDPNETEPEPDLPPPLTKAQPRSKRPLPRSFKREFSPSNDLRSQSGSPNTRGAPSVASLLASAQDHNQSPYSRHSSPNQNPTLSRPPPPPQASNPIFLPFPAPSPTSPFLTSSGGVHSAAGSHPGSGPGSSSGSTSISGPPDPSPFLAPMSGMSLFGGVIPLENGLTSPIDTMSAGRYSQHSSANGQSHGSHSKQQNSPPQLTLPPSKSFGDDFSTSRSYSREVSSSMSVTQVSGTGSIVGGANESVNRETASKDMPAEEAANLLLAFSSPDTLGPQIFSSSNNSSTATSISGSLTMTRGRRSTLDSDDFEFSLDSGVNGLKNEDMVGKSAREILRMTEFQR
ncbi:hypothetical protein I317_04934 [Kwoniella heveanensis CBS 569]|nr:hypothetical protein I317_04934 [Kwoniella heveanensis CBS 569]